ncbi:hypothetical protein [Isoptericola sp. NPDC057559]|uniref:hypothetical protein n=1 Tax=Isoptericola sp. NPDC057559 TaxID=3346168 RepID=UPI00367B319D
MAEIDLRPERDPRVFRYGFACFAETTPTDRTLVRDWSTLRLHGHVLAVHPDAEVRVVPTPAGTCAVIGEVFVAHGGEGLDEVLARHVTTGDWEAIDRLSGRFALLVFTASSVRVLNDPIGSRTVYYTLRGPAVVGSHAALVAGLAGVGLDGETSRYMAAPEYRARRTRYLPGDLTRYRHVVTLVPNSVVDLGTRRTQRYWPRVAPGATTFADVFELVDEYFKAYATFLSARYTPVVGATGGSDCRTLLAGLVAHGVAPRLVTWPGLPPAEVATVERMVAHLGLPHTVVDDPDVRDPQVAEVMSISALNTGHTRGRPRIPAMLAPHVEATDVFVRGYGGEVMRGSWNSAFVPSNGDGLAGMIRQFYTRAVREPSTGDQAFTRSAFEGFAARGHVEPENPPYDLGDLHYLEQRMAVWAAVVMGEADTVMRTHAGLNSRPIYLASMALPDEERFDKQLMFRIVAEYDQRLAAL